MDIAKFIESVNDSKHHLGSKYSTGLLAMSTPAMLRIGEMLPLTKFESTLGCPQMFAGMPVWIFEQIPLDRVYVVDVSKLISGPDNPEAMEAEIEIHINKAIASSQINIEAILAMEERLFGKGRRKTDIHPRI